MSETKSNTTPSTVKVISPATLEAGATFEATVDGKYTLLHLRFAFGCHSLWIAF